MELNKYSKEIMFLRGINFDNPYSIKVNFMKENGVCEVAPDGLLVNDKGQITYFNNELDFMEAMSTNRILDKKVRDDSSIISYNHPFIRIDFTPYEVGSKEQALKFKNLFVYIKKMSPNKDDTFDSLFRTFSQV